MVIFSASLFPRWTRPTDVELGLLRPLAVVAVDAVGLVDPVRLFVVEALICFSVFVGDSGTFETIFESLENDH